MALSWIDLMYDDACTVMRNHQKDCLRVHRLKHCVDKEKGLDQGGVLSGDKKNLTMARKVRSSKVWPVENQGGSWQLTGYGRVGVDHVDAMFLANSRPLA